MTRQPNETDAEYIARLERQTSDLQKDAYLLDALEEIVRIHERISLCYTEAWVETGEFGAVSFQGPAEFWVVGDDEFSKDKVIYQTLRDAITHYLDKQTESF